MYSRHKKASNSWVFGVFAWTVFSGAAVILRGVRWDEAYEHAQILAEMVLYPTWHPVNAYVRGVFSAQTQSAGALLGLGTPAEWLCGLRNFFFLAGAVLPIFLLAGRVARRPLWGHAAAAWVLQGVLLDFDGSYPTAVWPNLYSNGPIGTAFALLALTAALSQHFRLAAFLLGALPCVHIGQFPILGAWAVLFVAWRWRQGTLSALRPAVPYLGAGLACCVLVAMVQWRLASMPAPPPFDPAGTAQAVWEGYTSLHDPHRRFPPINGQIMLVGALVLAGAATAHSCRSREQMLYSGVLGYLSLIALAVWGTMAAQMLLGNPLPFVLTAWMPYRMINHVPPLLCAMLVGLLHRHRGTWMLSAVLLFGVFKPLLAPVLGAVWYVRYLAQGECTVFFLYGAALALALWPRRDRSRQKPLIPATIFVLTQASLAGVHHFGAICLLLGAGSVWLARTVGKPQGLFPPALRMNASMRTCFATAAILLAIGVATFHQWRFREVLPRDDFDRETAAYLKEHNPPGMPVVTEPYSYYLQARLDQPILVEAATPSLISYLPRLGPVINRMYTDIYGIDFCVPAPNATPSKDWETLWRTRTREEWKALARTYGFRYVLTPGPLPLHLPRVLEHGTSALYAVPED